MFGIGVEHIAVVGFVKYKFIEVGAGFLVSTSLGILTERLASVEFNTGTTLWTIPPARAMLLGNPPCLIAFCIGSASVSLEVQIWPSSAACCFVFGSLHLFRFCPILLSPLDELTFATSDEGLDISILVGGGRLETFLGVEEPYDESVLEELERLDSTR